MQLYPRTSHQILYCLIALSGIALFLAWGRVRDWARAHEVEIPLAEQARLAAERRPRGAAVGALCALALSFAAAGSTTTDAFMSSDPKLNRIGNLACYAHNTQLPNGKCPKYATRGPGARTTTACR